MNGGCMVLCWAFSSGMIWGSDSGGRLLRAGAQEAKDVARALWESLGFISCPSRGPSPGDPGPSTGGKGRGVYAPSPFSLTPSCRKHLKSPNRKGPSSTILITPLVQLPIERHNALWQLLPWTGFACWSPFQLTTNQVPHNC